MTDDNLVQLHTVQSTPVDADDSTYLNVIRTYLQQRVDDEFAPSSVELDAPRSDEREVGALSMFERECFVMGTILKTYIDDEVREIEARNAEKVAKLMREQKIDGYTAAQQLMSDPDMIDKETREFVNLCHVTRANLMSMYEWGVRSRHDEWDSRLIVRNKFVAYAYNG